MTVCVTDIAPADPAMSPLRPQDIAVALQLALRPGLAFKDLAQSVGLSQGEAHNAVMRLAAARLVRPDTRTVFEAPSSSSCEAGSGMPFPLNQGRRVAAFRRRSPHRPWTPSSPMQLQSSGLPWMGRFAALRWNHSIPARRPRLGTIHVFTNSWPSWMLFALARRVSGGVLARSCRSDWSRERARGHDPPASESESRTPCAHCAPNRTASLRRCVRWWTSARIADDGPGRHKNTPDQ